MSSAYPDNQAHTKPNGDTFNDVASKISEWVYDFGEGEDHEYHLRRKDRTIICKHVDTRRGKVWNIQLLEADGEKPRRIVASEITEQLKGIPSKVEKITEENLDELSWEESAIHG